MPTWAMVLREAYSWQIRACLTTAAAALVAPDAVAATTRNPVLGPHWPTSDGDVPHLAAAQWADLVLVMPATADFIGKCAHGIADSLALNVVLNTHAPTVFVPAISEQANAKPAVRRNLGRLAEDGCHVVPPGPALSAHTGHRMAGGGMADLFTVLRFVSSVMLAG